MTGRPGYRTMEMIGGSSRRTSLVPLAFPCFVLRLIGLETKNVLDYQGRAGDHFHCTVEPSPGHIRCRPKVHGSLAFADEYPWVFPETFLGHAPKRSRKQPQALYCELSFPLQSPGSHRGGNPRKMGKNYKIPLPQSDPRKWGKITEKLQKYSENTFFVLFR